MFNGIFALISYLAEYFWFFIGYMGHGGSFPKPLSSKEEAEYLKKMNEGDINARNILIERNLRLVAHVAKKYAMTGQDNEDLISIGTIGLIKAVSSFNPEKNIKLATYSARCIENEILMHLRSSKKLQNEISLNESIGTDSEGNEISLIDILDDSDNNIIDKVSLNMQVSALYNKMSEILTQREAEILKLRFGLDNEPVKTQHEIAEKFNISRSYVSRIEKKAIGKLKEFFKN